MADLGELNVLLIGSSSVGKTTLVDAMVTKTKVTHVRGANDIGCHYARVDLGPGRHTAVVGDTAGNQRFSILPQSTLRDQQVLFVVFALNDATSFRRVWKEVTVAGMTYQPWLADALTLTRDLRREMPTTVVLIGNKFDTVPNPSTSPASAGAGESPSGVSPFDVVTRLKKMCKGTWRDFGKGGGTLPSTPVPGIDSAGASGGSVAGSLGAEPVAAAGGAGEATPVPPAAALAGGLGAAGDSAHTGHTPASTHHTGLVWQGDVWGMPLLYYQTQANGEHEHVSFLIELLASIKPHKKAGGIHITASSSAPGSGDTHAGSGGGGVADAGKKTGCC